MHDAALVLSIIDCIVLLVPSLDYLVAKGIRVLHVQSHTFLSFAPDKSLLYDEEFSDQILGRFSVCTFKIENTSQSIFSLIS